MLPHSRHRLCVLKNLNLLSKATIYRQRFENINASAYKFEIKLTLCVGGQEIFFIFVSDQGLRVSSAFERSAGCPGLCYMESVSWH
jgi:hypothetical protein